MSSRKADARRAKSKLGFARQLRSNPTDAERRLWSLLRNGQLAGLKFRRQHPIGPYVADFFCPAVKLVIELDGDQHGRDAAIARDARRDQWLEGCGYRVLRLPNRDVLQGEPLEVIWHAANAGSPLPERPLAVRPSLKGRVK